jgi:DNA-binding transcriptional LysR family regulator
MDTLTSIKVFQQIVDSGSFVAAAERLDVSTATVSKHLMHIEKRLGVRLLNRNSRSVSVTEPGRVYYERCKIILDDLDATELELGSLNSAPRGTLRITCPSWFAGNRLANTLALYGQRYPEIVVDVSFDDRFIDIVAEGYDVALRVTRDKTLPPGMIARAVRPVRFFIGASREYLKRNGSPQAPEELAAHPCIAVGSADSWVFAGQNARLEVPMRVVLRYRSMMGVAHAVAAGIGLALLPDVFFDDPVFRDVLTPVLPTIPIDEPTLHLVYVSRRYLPLKLRTFIDFILDPATRVSAPHIPGLDDG